MFDKLWNELLAQLKEKNVEAEISEAARIELIKRGYDRSMGARPMRRTIRNVIHRELAREILFGSLLYGGKVDIDYDGREFTFNYISNEAPDDGTLSVDAVSQVADGAGMVKQEEAVPETVQENVSGTGTDQTVI